MAAANPVCLQRKESPAETPQLASQRFFEVLIYLIAKKKAATNRVVAPFSMKFILPKTKAGVIKMKNNDERKADDLLLKSS